MGGGGPGPPEVRAVPRGRAEHLPPALAGGDLGEAAAAPARVRLPLCVERRADRHPCAVAARPAVCAAGPGLALRAGPRAVTPALPTLEPGWASGAR